jgi:hypothetical protein
LKLDLPALAGIQNPGLISFELNGINAEQTLPFKVVHLERMILMALIQSHCRDWTVSNIQTRLSKSIMITSRFKPYYPHASIRALRMNIKKEGSVVGYIAGAGDEIPSKFKKPWLRGLGNEE